MSGRGIDGLLFGVIGLESDKQLSFIPSIKLRALAIGGSVILGKSVLWVAALLFSGYGLTSLFSPEIPAGFAGLEMTNGDAFAEIGAMYGGLQLGIGLLCLLAALKRDHYSAGLMLLVVGVGILAVARLFSSLVAPEPVGTYTIGAICYEFATAILAGIALKNFNSNNKYKLK